MQFGEWFKIDWSAIFGMFSKKQEVKHSLMGLKLQWEVQILMELGYAAAKRDHVPVSELRYR
jgi:hypothetical protein